MAGVFWVGLGGAAGAMGRYLLTLGMTRWFGTGFAWGTFTVNLLGSFLLALLATAGPSTDFLTPDLRLALGAGVMGGFTTYSTFSFETLGYLQSGQAPLAIANVVMTVVACLLACWLGVALGRHWVG